MGRLMKVMAGAAWREEMGCVEQEGDEGGGCHDYAWDGDDFMVRR